MTKLSLYNAPHNENGQNLMTDKYNLALIPSQDKIEAFAAYAQNTFPIKPDLYLLGTYSIPHVTLCHFVADAKNIHEIVSIVRTMNIPLMELTFAKQRSKTYPADSIWGQWSWVSLLPDKIAELKNLHLQIAKIVKPTNAAFADYDPHLTLFNSKDHTACNRINLATDASPVLSDSFHIALGRLDDIGQIKEVLTRVSDPDK